MNLHSTKTVTIALLLGLALGLLSPAGARAQGADSSARSAPWDERILERLALLPVQDGGRIKPIDSLADLKLLTFNGKRTLKLSNGEKLEALPWFLDCLFYPEQARTYPSFRIQNDAVLIAVGLEPKAKRAWYSFHELEPGIEAIFEQASQAQSVRPERRTPVQRQTLKLANDLSQFEELLGSFTPLRLAYPTGGNAELRALFDGQSTVGLGTMLAKTAELEQIILASSPEDEEGRAALQILSERISTAVFSGEEGITFLPAAEGSVEPEVWWNVSGVVLRVFEKEAGLQQAVAWLASLERLEAKKGDTEAFLAELDSLAAELVATAEARGAYDYVPLEVRMNSWQLFYGSLICFVLAFVLTIGTWIAPKSKWLHRGVWGTTIVATLLVATGITLRCIIRGRPPVLTLYDTILFVAATSVILCMIIERFTRVRVALAGGVILGAAGMFLAERYELQEVTSAGDTMSSVMAVLDTNYYLAIHVVTITLGYSAGLVAGVYGHVWILGRLFGLHRGDEAFYRTVTQMTFGAVCFGLLLSLFGTIMGGVWANDSWGRFWGWDPKENGALLICLWQLVILHAYFGGYIRARGLAVMAVLGGVVVSASWWGVNLLNVGLHTYGFTSGIAQILFGVWIVELLVVLLAGVDRLRRTPDTSEMPGTDPWPQ